MTTSIIPHHFGYGRVARKRRAMPTIRGNRLILSRTASKPWKIVQMLHQAKTGLEKGADHDNLTLPIKPIWGISVESAVHMLDLAPELVVVFLDVIKDRIIAKEFIDHCREFVADQLRAADILAEGQGAAHRVRLVVRKIIFVSAALFVLTLAGYTASAMMSDTVTARLGHRTFEIPKKYALQGSIPGWISNLTGLDDGSRAFLLDFPAEELAKAVPGYQAKDGRYVEAVGAILNVLEPYEVARYENPDRFRDLWEKIVSEKEQIVEPYRDSNWFKVHRVLDRYHGDVVRQFPKIGDKMPKDPLDFWVASCRIRNSPIRASGKSERCLTYVFYEDIAIEFYISGQNLLLIDEVRAYLKSKVDSWEVQR